MTPGSIAALLATMVVLSAAPGPADFAVVARSIASGFGHGLLMVGGIILADFLFILLAVYSLAAVAQSMGTLFVLIKYTCGAYLIWLGIGSIRTRPRGAGTVESAGHSRVSSFVGGVLITLGDPKAILFYMGLFPAFVDLAGISVTDTLTIMLLATIAVGGVKTGYAYLAERARRLFEHPRARRALDLTAGALLVATGAFVVLGSV